MSATIRTNASNRVKTLHFDSPPRAPPLKASRNISAPQQNPRHSSNREWRASDEPRTRKPNSTDTMVNEFSRDDVIGQVREMWDAWMLLNRIEADRYRCDYQDEVCQECGQDVEDVFNNGDEVVLDGWDWDECYCYDCWSEWYSDAPEFIPLFHTPDACHLNVTTAISTAWTTICCARYRGLHEVKMATTPATGAGADGQTTITAQYTDRCISARIVLLSMIKRGSQLSNFCGSASFTDGETIWTYLNGPMVVYLRPDDDVAQEHIREVTSRTYLDMPVAQQYENLCLNFAAFLTTILFYIRILISTMQIYFVLIFMRCIPKPNCWPFK